MASENPGADIARNRYNLIAPLYDPLLGLVEGHGFEEWRKLLWSKVEGRRILEVGVGTGLSFPYYPETGSIIAIDISENMLKRAREKARKNNLRVQLEIMDMQRMAFASNSFDTVTSALTFCAVKDPQRGLAEVKRVMRSGGKLVMLEHVISDNPTAARIMNFANPLIAAVTGENINRDTVYNVEKSGLIIEKVTRLNSIFRLIEARKEMIYMLR